MTDAIATLAQRFDALVAGTRDLRRCFDAADSGRCTEDDLVTIEREAAGARDTYASAQQAIAERRQHDSERLLHNVNNRLTGVLSISGLARLDAAGAVGEQLANVEDCGRRCAGELKAVARDLFPPRSA